MGPDQLSGVMEQVQRNSAKAKGQILNEEALQADVSSYRESVRNDSKAYRTSAYGLDDGVIDPRDTREILGICIEVVKLPGVKGADEHRVLARM